MNATADPKSVCGPGVPAKFDTIVRYIYTTGTVYEILHAIFSLGFVALKEHLYFLITLYTEKSFTLLG